MILHNAALKFENFYHAKNKNVADIVSSTTMFDISTNNIRWVKRPALLENNTQYNLKSKASANMEMMDSFLDYFN